MIDEYEEIEKGQSARSKKILNDDDWFFQCHLPESKVMPATLQIEGMLQTLVLLLYETIDHGDLPALITDINVKILSSVLPCQDIIYEALLMSFRRGITKGSVVGRINNKVLCKGEFSYASPHLMPLPLK